MADGRLKRDDADDARLVLTEGPDPLGKRALFWAPATREDSPPINSERDMSGKHALFSDEARAGVVLSGPGRRIAALATNDKTRRAAAAEVASDRAGVAPARPLGRFLPAIEVSCSSCGTASRVELMEFLVLHLPVWLWRPGRGYTRFMTCPACRRRAWVSASLAPGRSQPTAQDAG